MKKKAILILDSGIGGLYITYFLLQKNLKSSLIYFSDYANFPYGSKNKKLLSEILEKNINTIMQHYNVVKILIACNSASLNCISYLRFKLPLLKIWGIFPPFKKAFEYSKNKSILFIATKVSLESQIFKKQLDDYFIASNKNRNPEPEILFYKLYFDTLVKKIEENPFNQDHLKNEIEKKIISFLKKHPQIDVIVLGCTHYHFIYNILKIILKNNNLNITILESSHEFIKKLKFPFRSKDSKILKKNPILYTNRKAYISKILKKKFKIKNLTCYSID